MSTGPQHYRLAEGAIENAKFADFDSPQERFHLGIAQVHATLALAAAMGTYGVGDDTRSVNDVNAWENVAGEYTAQARADRERRAVEDDGGALNDYGRDYAEEEDVRRAVREEGEAELAAEASALSSTPLAVAFGAAPRDYTAAHAGTACMICLLPFNDGDTRCQTGFHDGRQLYSHETCSNAREWPDQAETDDVRQMRAEMNYEAGDDTAFGGEL